MPLLASGAILGTSPAALRLSAAAAAAFMARAAWDRRTDTPGGRRWAGAWFGLWILMAGVALWPFLFGPRAGTLVLIGLAGLAAEGLADHLGRRGTWRSLLGDLTGTIVSALLVLAYDLVHSGSLSPKALVLALITYLFWVASVVRVRSQIRERTNRRFHQVSFVVHLACLGLAAAAGGLLAGMLLPAALHAAWLLLRPPRPEPALRVGIREIAHALGFVILAALLGRG